MNKIAETLQNFFIAQGASESTSDFWTRIVLLIAIVVIAFLIQKLITRFVVGFIIKLAAKTKAAWDDIIFAPNVMKKLAGLTAPILIYLTAPAVFEVESAGLDYTQRVCLAYMILMFARFLTAFLDAFNTVYNSMDRSRERPIKGLIQTLQVILYFLAGLGVVSILIKQSPWGILVGMGAFAAILLLVFQDSILGFVSGIQLSVNNMVHVGDWIEMPKYGVDGDVLEITLNTVKVQNWDKTIVTIPPTLLMKDSFKNWRGMSESGGRRVKRSIFIDMNSVKFCDVEMLKKFHKIQVVTEYIDDKEKILKDYNAEHDIDNSVIVNGRRQTNLGVFRAYLDHYLKNYPLVNHRMTCMVRQLQPTEMGIPLELYFFTATTAWVEYEGIQSDIFDHVLAVVPYFELNVFQTPSGTDIKRINCGGSKG